MDYDQYWDYHPGDVVMTCDGYGGTVKEVTDGPVPGNEDYLVELHDGMGGGHYTSGQLTKGTNPRTAKEHEAIGVHLASEDYPELGDLLWNRPDPGRMTFAASRTAASEPDGQTEVRDTGQPDACSYCGSTQFANQTDNGRVRQATCAVCGGTMSAHPGAQWTPELIGDPSNHPSTAVDPASGASQSGGQAGINDLVDFDERVSKSAGLYTADGHGLSHVYRGVHGDNAAAAAEAHRKGELGHGMHGRGIYTTSSPDLAMSYAQAHMGDHTGVFMHGQIRPDANVAHLDEVPRRKREQGGAADWARDQGHDVLTDGANTHIVVNPRAVTWDPKNYDLGEAYRKFNRYGDDYGDGPEDLHRTAAADGPDWCTWRKAAQCTFPNDRNNSLLAEPQVRGICPWDTRWEQQVCPISEPGPGSGVSRKASLGRMAADDDYRMQHQAPDAEFGAPLHDVTQGSRIFPHDFHEHPEWYHGGEPHDHESMSAIRRAHGFPDKKVTVYRALPAEHAHKGIRPGDWVSTSKTYARTHGRQSDSQHDWPVISAKVPAKHLHTEGDINEWGYGGPDTVHGGVAYKGGHHQEVRQRADGSIRQVVRRAPGAEKSRAEQLTQHGITFSHYKPNQHGEGNHDVVAYDKDENWAGHVRADNQGNVQEVEISPEHRHLPLEEHMRSMLPKSSSSIQSGAHQAALEAKMAGIPAGPCESCEGKGKISWTDEDPDWKGDPDENPGKTFVHPCDDCGGSGHQEAVSDEELARQERENQQRQEQERKRDRQNLAAHIESAHGERDDLQPPSREETEDCPWNCPLRREYSRNSLAEAARRSREREGKPKTAMARVAAQMREALGPNSASRPASPVPAHRTAALLDLYHRTTPEAAAAIHRDKAMHAKENTGETYWSTFRGDEPGAQAQGYGEGVVHIRVPEHAAELEDEFPSGEEHYRVHPRNLQPHHFVED